MILFRSLWKFWKTKAVFSLKKKKSHKLENLGIKFIINFNKFSQKQTKNGGSVSHFSCNLSRNLLLISEFYYSESSLQKYIGVNNLFYIWNNKIYLCLHCKRTLIYVYIKWASIYFYYDFLNGLKDFHDTCFLCKLTW